MSLLEWSIEKVSSFPFLKWPWELLLFVPSGLGPGFLAFRFRQSLFWRHVSDLKLALCSQNIFLNWLSGQDRQNSLSERSHRWNDDSYSLMEVYLIPWMIHLLRCSATEISKTCKVFLRKTGLCLWDIFKLISCKLLRGIDTLLKFRLYFKGKQF